MGVRPGGGLGGWPRGGLGPEDNPGEGSVLGEFAGKIVEGADGGGEVRREPRLRGAPRGGENAAGGRRRCWGSFCGEGSRGPTEPLVLRPLAGGVRLWKLTTLAPGLPVPLLRRALA